MLHVLALVQVLLREARYKYWYSNLYRALHSLILPQTSVLVLVLSFCRKNGISYRSCAKVQYVQYRPCEAVCSVLRQTRPSTVLVPCLPVDWRVQVPGTSTSTIVTQVPQYSVMRHQSKPNQQQEFRNNSKIRKLTNKYIP